MYSTGELDLDALSRMPYLEAKARLMECHGIGTKIADCVAVFSLEKLGGLPHRRLGPPRAGRMVLSPARRFRPTGCCWSGPKTTSAPTLATPINTCSTGVDWSAKALTGISHFKLLAPRLTGRR